MISKIGLILILLTGTFICEEVDVSRKNYDDEVEEFGDSADGNRRSGKLLWSYHPIVDLVLQTGEKGFVYKSSGDFFNFIRDSYPLPDGKYFYLSLIRFK